MIRRTSDRIAIAGILMLTIYCLACRKEKATPIPVATLKITYPFEGAVFPPEIAAPTFRWQDAALRSAQWAIGIEFEDGGPGLEFTCNARHWRPTDRDWETIKQRSVGQLARVTIRGLNSKMEGVTLSTGQVSCSTSLDEVGAPIFYREVNLPFRDAIKDPAEHIRWRFGPISARQLPPVVLKQLPVCGNCHSFSADGSVLGMDVDYANDKGSYAICRVDEEIQLDDESIITWADFNKEAQSVDKEGEKKTFGLLSQVSPDGRYVISTVKDLSVFRPVDNLYFSQLFFPVKGILCIFDRETKTFAGLPGADDEGYVQSNPVWSPDGKYIVFARAKALDVPDAARSELGVTEMQEMPDFLSGKKTFRFDLYRIPFNEGRGGKVEPLLGASHNGRSNYFARYSPDGRWIVFCQANSFMLLQSDSELYIIPSEGGEARRLACNRDLMNSWHSWSPNGNWLVFSSKAFSPYTQLFLTHIDQAGESSIPVVLSNFTQPDMAANIPEFVNTSPDAIVAIRDAFAEDLHYVRAGDECAMRGDNDQAIENFKKALEVNPDCGEAHRLWGVLLMSQRNYPEAEQRFLKAIERSDDSAYAYWNLAKLRGCQGKPIEALAMFRKAIELNPKYGPIRRDYGMLLLQMGRRDEANKQLARAKELQL